MKRLSLLAVVTLGMLAVTSAARTSMAQDIQIRDALDAQASSRVRKPTKPPVRPARAPEPASLVLAGVGVAAVCGLARRKKGK